MQTLGPQPGPQSEFLSTPADIAIYGGAAFGGKTFGLLLDSLRHVNNGRASEVIFRRTTPQIDNEGGLWDESANIFPLSTPRPLPRRHKREWIWPSGYTVRMTHMERESNRFDWHGAQIPVIKFDELTLFTASQFWYMLSRNRSAACGFRPYIRATCNPDPDSFVAQLVAWYIDQDSGLPIPSRSGRLRWFLRDGDDLVWSDERQELERRYPRQAADAKSFTFIASKFTDNVIGMQRDPQYMANLRALHSVERERLLYGNWKIRAAAGDFFKRRYFEIVDRAPERARRIRFWDLAATKPSAENPDPDWTAGILVSRDDRGFYCVEHVDRMQESPGKVEKAITDNARHDGHDTMIGMYQDPGQAGKAQVQHLARQLAGYIIRVVPASKNLETLAAPASSQAENGNIAVVRGAWNEAFFNELENFPKGRNDDQVAALAGAVGVLAGQFKVEPMLQIAAL